MSRINAYVCLADPAYIAESVRSYYHLVDTIVVSYDHLSVGWTGAKIPVDECLAQLKAADPENKMRFRPGDFHSPELTPVQLDTYQRQTALDEASEGADWVLQLDTDEVMSDTKTFRECLALTEAAGKEALHYPSRWLFAAVNEKYFLESSSRLWQPLASYPGPVAVRPGHKLSVCRQAPTASLFRVDIRKQNTDPWYPKDTPVDHVIDQDSAIWHFSMVRSDEHMLNRLKWHTHHDDPVWKSKMEYWFWAKKHPLMAVMTTPFRRKRDWASYRVLRLTKVELAEEIQTRQPKRQIESAIR
jgi:hypothetical protein